MRRSRSLPGRLLLLLLPAALLAGLFTPSPVTSTAWGADSSFQLSPKQTNPPAAPANLVAKPRSNWTYLEWDDPNDPSITKYQFRRSTDNGKTWLQSWTDISGSANAPWFNLAYTINGTTYTVEVRAVNNNGAGAAASVTFTPWPPAPAPKGFTATPGDKQVKLSWNDPGDWRITKYWMRTSTNGGSSWTDWFNVAGSSATTTSHTVKNLTNGTEYTFQLQAVRNVDYGGYAASATATPKVPSAPDAPKNARAAAGNSSVTLSWTNPNDATITRYQYRVSDDSGNTWDPDWTDITNSGANTTSYRLTGLTNGTTYRIEVRAVNSIDDGVVASMVATPRPPPPVSGPGPAPTKPEEETPVEQVVVPLRDYFVDDDNSVHEAAINTIAAAGITSGCTTERYCGDQPVTRAQMATFLTRALKLPAATAPAGFADVDPDGTHTAAINTIAAAGITSGCTTERYCGDQPVTRAQMATFLTRALKLPAATAPAGFADVDPDGTHTAAINTIAAAGITSGCTTERYCGDQPVTRAQMATFLTRALKLPTP